METTINTVLYLHIILGSIALVTGLVALLSPKGQPTHNRSGKLYFYAMTGVFLTGILVAGARYNRFLFLIAFLSYYSVFCGVRILRLKQLHQQQRPHWIDWLAGLLNTLTNAIFLALGLYYSLWKGSASAGAWLSIGFGIGGLLLSYTNLKPFFVRPTQPYHWYLSHIGNMVGAYIATVTAFLSTMTTRYDLLDPFWAFALPSMIGIPVLLLWQKRVERRF